MDRLRQKYITFFAVIVSGTKFFGDGDHHAVMQLVFFYAVTHVRHSHTATTSGT